MAAPGSNVALGDTAAYKIAAEVTKSLLAAESQTRLLRLENELLRRQLLDAAPPPGLIPHDNSELVATFLAAQECERNLEALYLAIVAQLRLHASVESELVSLAHGSVMQQQRIQELSEACEEHTSILADALRRELADAHRARASPGGRSPYVASAGHNTRTPDDYR